MQTACAFGARAPAGVVSSRSLGRKCWKHCSLSTPTPIVRCIGPPGVLDAGAARATAQSVVCPFSAPQPDNIALVFSVLYSGISTMVGHLSRPGSHCVSVLPQTEEQFSPASPVVQFPQPSIVFVPAIEYGLSAGQLVQVPVVTSLYCPAGQAAVQKHSL